MTARLSDLSAGRFLPPGRFLVLISVRDWVDRRAMVRAGRIRKFEKIHLIRDSNRRPRYPRRQQSKWDLNLTSTHRTHEWRRLKSTDYTGRSYGYCYDPAFLSCTVHLTSTGAWPCAAHCPRSAKFYGRIQVLCLLSTGYFHSTYFS
jgi:hypothetical protein